MTPLMNTYINSHPTTKVGVGAWISGTAAWALGLSNPVSGSFLALAAAGQCLAWLPSLANRCRRPIAHQPVPVAIRAPLQHQHPVARPEIDLSFYNGGHADRDALQTAIEASRNDGFDEKQIQEIMDRSVFERRLNRDDDRELQDALLASLQDDAFDKKEIEEARFRSLQFNESRDPYSLPIRFSSSSSSSSSSSLGLFGRQQAAPDRKCALQMMLEMVSPDDRMAIAKLPTIPDEFMIHMEKDRYYHAGNLVLTMLTQTSPQDVFDRKPISHSMLERLALTMGIDPDRFANLWRAAKQDQESEIIGMNDEDHAKLKTDVRFRILHEMLTEPGTRDELQLRRNFLKFLKTQEIWRNKFL